MVAVLLFVDAPSDCGANCILTPEGAPSAVSDTEPTKEPVRPSVSDVVADAPRAIVPAVVLAESVIPADAGGGVVASPPPLHAARRENAERDINRRRIIVLVDGA